VIEEEKEDRREEGMERWREGMASKVSPSKSG